MPHELKFEVAFKNASNSTREAPWYGVYNWILSQVIFPHLCDDPLNTLTTITYPQYPLTQDIDTDMRDEDDNDEDDDEDDDHDSVKPDLMDDLWFNRGTLSTPYHFSRAMAPSPESTRAMATIPESTRAMATSPESTRAMATSSDSTSPHQHPNFGFPSLSSPVEGRSQKSARTTMALSPPNLRTSAQNRQPLTKRSTRIPDFVELLHLNGDDHLISSILLITEIKKEPLFGPPVAEFFFVPILEQTELQAADFLHVSRIGVIIALGRYWKYIEYTREAVLHERNRPDLRSSSQQTYRSESPDDAPDNSWSAYPKFEEKCEPGSDDVLLVVRERMMQLAREYHHF
ncbi:hypothetical protein H0H92_005982 [Tricholoma furcatifolium]|nr:hypothetical protein H0H92_005982 [Tricholoma furcatifolium]